MKETSVSEQCTDDTQQFVINLPCRLAKRIEKYALETGNTFTGVVIEALDALISRGRKHD
jgi:hypothetical protein